MEQPSSPSPPLWRTVAVSLAIGVAVAAVVIGATLVVGSSDEVTLDGAGEQIGPVSGPANRPLPDRALEDLDGQRTVRLAEYAGTPLLVNFWATWCPPCVEEMPDFNTLAVQAGDRLAVAGVNVQDNRETAQAFAEELGIDYDLLFDPAGELYEEVRGLGMPTTLFVDADQTIVYRHTGVLDLQRLRQLVREHLAVQVPSTEP